MRTRTTILMVAILIAFAGLVRGATTFVEHQLPHALGDPRCAVPVDLDQDGRTDILTCDWITDEIIWLRNHGDQVFLDVHSVENSAGTPYYLNISDLDLDGDIDILAGMRDSNAVCWYENDGDESFTRHKIGGLGEAHMARAVDVDEDGDLDVWSAGTSGGNTLWINDGSMGFTGSNLMASVTTQCVDFADFDGDDDIDLLANDWNAGARWFENDGSENFTPHVLPLDAAHWVRSVDLDGDDDIDIAFASFNPCRFGWWENDGAGSFTIHDLPTDSSGGLVIDWADFDGDGDLDCSGAAWTTNDVSWWENDGTMTFDEIELADGTYPHVDCAHTGDLDNDGDADILCIAWDEPNIRWYENERLTVDFSCAPLTGVAPYAVTFNEAIDVEGAVTLIEWDFDGDGSTDLTGSSPVWVYDSPGVQGATMRVTTTGWSGERTRPSCVTAYDQSACLAFDGDSTRVTCPATSELNLIGDLTLEAWISPTGWGTYPFGAWGQGGIVHKEQFAFYLIGEHFVQNNHSVCLKMLHADARTSFSCAPVDAIALDEWQHVAVAYDATTSTTRMWIDGSEVTVTHSSTPSGAIADNTTNDLHIGNSFDHQWSFEGKIDEVRMWSVARSGGDITDGMLSNLTGGEPGLVGVWSMDEGNGASLADGSFGGHDAVVESAVWGQGVIHYATGVSEPGIQEDEVMEGVAASPNPFTPRTELSFVIPSPAVIELTIHDVAGRLVRSLGGATKQAGPVRVPWDGTDDAGHRVASGIYFCRVTAGDYEAAGRLVHIK